MIDFYIDTIYNGNLEFDCGYDVFNAYIKHNKDSAVMHYIIDASNEKLIAYFSLLSSALLFGDSNAFSAIPAIELKMFALNKDYQKLGLASSLLNAIKTTIGDYSNEYVGAQIILLHAVPVDKVVRLYKENGFSEIAGLFTSYKSIFNEGCIPMFKPIAD